MKECYTSESDWAMQLFNRIHEDSIEFTTSKISKLAETTRIENFNNR